MQILTLLLANFKVILTHDLSTNHACWGQFGPHHSFSIYDSDCGLFKYQR